jgi:hypothetical protein
VSSRLTRTLLKLYPRRVCDRYGDELLDLHDELRADGELSRSRVIRDALAGALLVRTARQRTHIAISATVVVIGLALTATIIVTRDPYSPPRPSLHRAPNVTASAGRACFAAAGSPCSQVACTQFATQGSTQDAVAYLTTPAVTPEISRTNARCAAYPRARRPRPLFVTRASQPSPPRP